MKTFLPQNQFISNSVSHVPVDAGSGAVNASPPSTTAPEAISEAAGKHPFPSVSADSEHEQQRKTLGVTDGRDHHLTDHIHELFFYARKLSAEARIFVPDYPGIYQAMLDPNAPRALETDPVWADDPPLFLQKREA